MLKKKIRNRAIVLLVCWILGLTLGAIKGVRACEPAEPFTQDEMVFRPDVVPFIPQVLVPEIDSEILILPSMIITPDDLTFL